MSNHSRHSNPLIVKISGTALDEPAANALVWQAIARWSRALPGGLVVVHGGGKLADARLTRLGLDSQKIDGIRITPPTHIDEVIASLAGLANFRVCSALRVAGAAPVGLTLADGNSLAAGLKRSGSVDYGLVGDVSPGNPSLVETLISSGFLPVFSSIALSSDGVPLNVNADDAAAALAATLCARELLYLSDVKGVQDDRGRLIDSLDGPSISDLIARAVIRDGMVAKVRSALEASRIARCPIRIAGLAEVERIRSWPPESPIGTLITDRAVELESV